jgi:hypothetical protein
LTSFAHDVLVVAETEEELRPVGLRIDRLQLDSLDESPLLRAFRLWLDVQAPYALPDAGHGSQASEVA